MQHIATLLILPLLLGCDRNPPVPESAAAEPPQQQENKRPRPRRKPPGPGVIHGTVLFKGKRPAPVKLKLDAQCAKMHPRGLYRSTMIVSAKGGLKNVFIWIQKGLGKREYPVPQKAALLDQKGCRYIPHVMGLRVGQRLEIRNSDPMNHNSKASPMLNSGFNRAQGPRSSITRKFSDPEVMIRIECNLHPWMSAYIGVLKHPYFAVSSADGAFQLPKLPPGRYTIGAWHEGLGQLRREVKVGKAPKKVGFTFKRE